MKRPPLDPELLRDRLSAAQGKQYWRCLDELADDPAFQAMLQQEFPDRAGEWTDHLSRRRFLTLLGASLALGGLAGCRPPSGVIMPYVRQPENLVPGKPLYYATAMPLGGFATGLLVEQHEGRPTKIEGNPDHPASRGATTPQNQAAILGLYDPDRSQTVAFRGKPRGWEDVLHELRTRLRPGSGREKGQRVAVLSEAVGSPTLAWVRDAFRRAYPQARWFAYEPVNSDNAREGARLAFGRPLHSYCKVQNADVVVALDADFLGPGPAQLAYTREWSARRRDGRDKKAMNRVYAFETTVTITGANADNRLPVRPGVVEDVARALAARLGVSGVEAPKLDDKPARWVEEIVKDLRSRPKGRTLVLAGDGQPPAVHALAHAVNAALGNVGSTVLFTELPDPPKESEPRSNMEALQRLTADIDKGEIDTLLILGGNPAYTAPADVPFAEALTTRLAKQTREQWLAVHLGPYFDETARLCHWHVPEAHFLEQWGDAVAYDGTPCVVQPLIAPLYAGRSPLELLAALTPRDEQTTAYDERTPYELVRAYWQGRREKEKKGERFEAFWQQALDEGVIKDVRWPTVTPKPAADLARSLPPRRETKGDVDLVFAPDPTVLDGRFANNGWLQEMPKPLTMLTWDNALLMSPATADRLGVRDRPGSRGGGEHGRVIANVVRVEHGGRSLDVPAFVLPGHADGAVTLHLGYGRTRAGRVGTKAGFNAYQLRLAEQPWSLAGVTLTKQAGTHLLACVQAHFSLEGRDLVRSATLGEYQKNPKFATDEHATSPRNEGLRHAANEVRHDQEHEHTGRRVPLKTTLYPNDHPYDGYKWGMAIDLSTCTGCGACVVACQSENNVPVVGKLEVTRGREMHWLRVDRYFESPRGQKDPRPEDVGFHLQPRLCQHCETAPCEVVCPVEATVHSDEGLNDMVYNRCVGTRYCANNCPYKVRRFNFLQYTDYTTPSLKLMYNPDVTVRTRGVMEKCTFCVQRIAYARIEAAKEAVDELHLPEAQRRRRDPNGRTDQGKPVPFIRDGEVITACQAACPAEAIVFGDLNDRDSRVSRLHASELRYDLLGELGTRPRVGYLAGLRNPNPALEGR